MNRNDKTLLILSPGFAANEADSTCLPAQQQLILALNKNNPSVRIVILAFQYPYSDQPYQWHGNTVIPFGGANRQRVYRLLLWLRVWKKLKELKKQNAIKGILCFWYGECAMIGKKFAKRHGLTCFTWILGQDARAGNRYAKWFPPKSGELVAISDFIASEFEANYAVRPGYIITNAVTPSLFPETIEARDIDIIGAGSLIALKRYDIFVEVVKQVRQIHPAIRTMICGKGPEQEKIESLIKENGLEENISLVGEIPYTEVLRLMQRSKILLHPSSYEGFSGVCLEALYAGAHVISFCNPKTAWIRHWHIVDSVGMMTAMVLELLSDTATVYKPVLPYDINDSAKEMGELFFSK